MADNDQRDIIDTLIAEAIGDGLEGMRRAGETVINRSNIRGLTPGQVVRQPYQYTGYSSPGPAAVRAQNDPASRALAEQAWNLALQPGDPTGGADHYYAPGTISQPSWAASMTPTGSYGGHAFFRSAEAPAVATQLDVGPPWPATPSARMEILRNASLGGQLAINPIRGVGPNLNAPVPANPSLQLASIRASQAAEVAPALRAAMNSLSTPQAPSAPPSRAVVAPIAPISPRSQQRPPVSASDRVRANGSQNLSSALSGRTMPTPAEVNLMYANNTVFPKPLNYVPPRAAPVPATMSGDMQLMRNSPLNTNRAPVPATMSASLAQSRMPRAMPPLPLARPGIGGPVPAPAPQMQSANMMLARDPRMMGLMPQNLIPAGNPQLQPMAIPVGTVLGLGANGGGVVQGRGGLLNSTTQSSDYWRRATGKSSGRGSDGNESLSLGV